MKRLYAVVTSAAIVLMALAGAPTAHASDPVPDGPSQYAGTLRLNVTGPDIFNTWVVGNTTGARCREASDVPPDTNGTYTLPPQGWLGLNTSGAVGNCAEVVSPVAYTSAVVEAHFWVAGDANGPADWPAFWMVGPNWPLSGEIDAGEGLATGPNGIQCLSATYHYGTVKGQGQSTGSTCIDSSAPAWHTVDIVRFTSGLVEVWYDGTDKWCVDTQVLPGWQGSVQPENIVLTLTNGVTGRPATLYIDYVRVWNFK